MSRLLDSEEGEDSGDNGTVGIIVDDDDVVVLELLLLLVLSLSLLLLYMILVSSFSLRIFNCMPRSIIHSSCTSSLWA